MLYGEAAGSHDLMPLVIDPALLDRPVRYESFEPGPAQFPHVYGPIPVTAVTEARQWRWTSR